MEVENLPVYVPTEEDKANPMVFANKLETIMSKALNIPISPLYGENGLLFVHTAKLGLPREIVRLL